MAFAMLAISGVLNSKYPIFLFNSLLSLGIDEKLSVLETVDSAEQLVELILGQMSREVVDLQLG
jgi:hypothetical protein